MEVPPPPPPCIADVISEMEWASGSDFECDGFDILNTQIASDEVDNFLLQDDALPSAESSSRSKRSRTHNNATEKHGTANVQPTSNDSDAEPPFPLATLNFVTLYATFERKFLKRAKKELGTDYLSYSKREEYATNAFLAARFVMALEEAGTPRASSAVFTADMTPDEHEQATEDALTPEEHLRAHLETRKAFDKLLPDRLALLAGLAFS